MNINILKHGKRDRTLTIVKWISIISEYEQIWMKLWCITKQMLNLRKVTYCNQPKHIVLYKQNKMSQEITNGLNMTVKVLPTMLLYCISGDWWGFFLNYSLGPKNQNVGRYCIIYIVANELFQAITESNVCRPTKFEESVKNCDPLERSSKTHTHVKSKCDLGARIGIHVMVPGLDLTIMVIIN